MDGGGLPLEGDLPLEGRGLSLERGVCLCRGSAFGGRDLPAPWHSAKVDPHVDKQT